MRSARVLLPLLGLGLTACGHLQPATAQFYSIDRPVLLSTVDRIGGGAPLPAMKVGEFEGKASASYSHSETDYGYYTVSRDTWQTDNTSIVFAAARALQGRRDADLRVTNCRAWGRGFISFISNSVLVEGDVVEVGVAR